MKSVLKLSIAVSMALASSLASAQHRNGPTTSGGGGNFCFMANNPKPILLDMVNEQGAIVVDDNLPGGQIEIPKSVRFRVVNPLTASLQDRIQYRLSGLAEKLPELYKIIIRGVQNTWFVATNEKFNVPISPYFPPNPLNLCHAGNTRAVIAFVDGFKITSIPEWNSASLDTQAYTVIHEAGRYAHLFLGFQVQNETLQEFVRNAIFNPDELKKNKELNRAYLKSLGLGDDYQRRVCEALPQARRMGLNAKVIRFFDVACNNPLASAKSLKEEASDGMYALSSYGTSGIRKQEIEDLHWLMRTVVVHSNLTDLNRAALGISFVAADFLISQTNEIMESRSENGRKLIKLFSDVMDSFKGKVK